MTEGLLEFQEEIVDDESEKICLIKARQVGGTTGFMKKAVREASQGARILVVSPTLDISQRALDQVPKDKDYVFEKDKRHLLVGDGVIIALTRDHIVEYLKSDEEEHEIDILFVDNAGEMPRQKLQGIFNPDLYDGRLWVCGTPLGDGPPELRRFFVQEDVSSYQVSADDVSHLDQEYLDRIADEFQEVHAENCLEGEFVDE